MHTQKKSNFKKISKFPNHGGFPVEKTKKKGSANSANSRIIRTIEVAITQSPAFLEPPMSPLILLHSFDFRDPSAYGKFTTAHYNAVAVAEVHVFLVLMEFQLLCIFPWQPWVFMGFPWFSISTVC
jgi:hypothetical protein